MLEEVGLGYLTLGQPSNTLSGAKPNEIKLVEELSRGAEAGRAVFVLDEPTTGLSIADTAKLIDLFHRFVDRGDTLVVIEHNLEVIREADWIVDLGPEGRGGRRGGGGGAVGELRKGGKRFERSHTVPEIVGDRFAG